MVRHAKRSLLRYLDVQPRTGRRQAGSSRRNESVRPTVTEQPVTSQTAGSAAADTDLPAPDEGQAPWWRDWRLPGLAGVMLLAAGIGIAAIAGFVEAERERDLRRWQDRLGLIADSRAADVAEWLAAQKREVSALAGNASVRLLLSELAMTGDLAAVTDAGGQVQYLDNLMSITAERGGFRPAAGGDELRANVELPTLAGIAVLDAEGRPVVATPRFALPELRPAGGEVATVLQRDAELGALLALATPVAGLQAEPGAQPVGAIVARRPVGTALAETLRQPGVRTEGLEILLVRPEGAAVAYLSPLADGTAPLGRRLDRDTPGLAAAQALSAPGAFLQAEDYAGTPVLATGRAVAGSDWTLLAKVDRAVALAEIEARADRLLLVLLLALGLAAALLLVAWRHGASRRATASARLHALAAAELQRQRHLLRLVTDSQPTAILILDDLGHVRFANARAGERVGMRPEEMLGKSLSSLVGSATAARTLTLAEQALEDGERVSDVLRIEGDPAAEGGRRIYLADHVPVPPSEDLPRGVLVVERDVTAELRERARRESTLDALIMTLVSVVDRRDPYAADHSHLVGELSQRLAREMGLDETQAETARVAGLLMNIGKILVPEELLTRQGALSEAEREKVRTCMNASAELLAGVSFDGPVVETLEQVQERIDGAGEKGLAGDLILPTARILAVANAFVAMVSARAHRGGLPVDGALSELMGEMGRRYDRGVIAALVNYLDNKGGRQHWEASAAE
jgi:PAS domain S-box-containing protein